MKLIEYPDAEMMMIDLANVLAGELEQCLLSHDRASFAVPGGTTPGPIFDVLCGAKHIDWARVDVMLTDERRVPEDHERSNTRLIRERLLVDAAAAAHYVNYIPEDDAGLATKADALRPHLPVSVMLLGMGADMHTASIFPNSPDLDHALTTDQPLAFVQPPDGLEPRVTLSANVLKGAMSRHIVIKGADKRAALEAAQKVSPQEAPIAAVLAGSTVHWAEG
ncbi:6-phosphogluconolactonase [Pseudooctadecabacter jejudonensis]|uniref:6-phosphogluconolactonase n=1 Tax=Pseudooctadecabacter jejudonensis TaxID=1391910 RepID=A0A1Y5RDA5_9RHOB|nr:6-phosphogluconolactonase [Pseudooctadecabacter jejudonensis]SLN14636.1 6-phosphogluconolactonase [Pseudooctadecabacter jejudonensis]